MQQATNTVQVARPPSEVFAFLADRTNDRQWRAGVIDVARKSASGTEAIYTQGVKRPFGRRVPADYEVTGVEPDRPIAFRAIAGPVRPEGSHRSVMSTAEGRFPMETTYYLGGPPRRRHSREAS